MRSPSRPDGGQSGHRGPPDQPGRPGSRRRSDELARPIAAGLNLGHEHVDKIAQSHERSQALGVSRIERPDLSPMGRSDLHVVRDRNLRLYDNAAPVMEMLYGQIVNTDSMVVLCDATGTVLHAVGDADFLGRASKVALAPGANWSESNKGTNAVGTALVEETPTLVHADEHFQHANHFLTCSAAPILDPRGNILGVLDVSGDRRSYHQHTMALVKMSARMIENHWLTDDYRHVMRLHFHSRVDFIGTLMEGILAVTAEGKVVGANRGALEQLGLSGVALRMHTLSTLFGTTVGALVDRFRSPLATPMPARCSSGRPYHLHARFNWPVWTSLAEAVSAPPQGHAEPKHEQEREPAPAPELQHGTARALPQPLAADRQPPGLPAGTAGLASLRTGDARMASAIDKLSRVLDHGIPVLLLGETGTGKARLARAMHQDSARARQPFVAVHCASLPAALIEAELFGGHPGALPDAVAGGSSDAVLAGQASQAGKIVQANGGTLFLDEVSDLPIGAQAQLLRVLQERQVTPLGSRQHVAVDVAIVCATQRNLRERVAAGLFREDLFYRLNGLAVRLPPLRERSDLMALVRRILDQQSADMPPGRQRTLDSGLAQLFAQCPWPGNVRQLYNVLRTAAVVAGPATTITREHLPDDFLEDAPTWAAAAGQPVALAAAPEAAASRSLEAQETDAIRQALDQAGGNITQAAKRLGISRNTIYRKLRWNGPPG